MYNEDMAAFSVKCCGNIGLNGGSLFTYMRYCFKLYCVYSYTFYSDDAFFFKFI